MTIRFNRNFSRRRVLQSLGLSAAALPFIPTLESEAGVQPAPMRFLSFFTPHGTIKENWQPTRVGGDFTLSPILAPLQPYKDILTVIEGLNVYPAGPPGGSHTVGPAYVFTGSEMLEGNQFKHQAVGTPHGWASSKSIDMAIAEQIGSQSAFQALQFGVQSGGLHPGSVMSYAGPDMPLPPQSNPHSMFAKLFGEAGIDPAAAAKLKADRLSVLDVLKPELHAAQGKVSAADRVKIDAHIDGLRQVEQRLTAEYDCEEPDLGEEYFSHDYDKTQEITTQQIDLLVESFACQITNVASLMMRVGENDNNPYPNLGILDAHHSTTHASDDDEDARALMTQIYTWYATQLAEIARRLSEIPEGDGSVLDNTVIFWGTEIAKGNNHSWEDFPFVLLGGKNVLRGNQYLSYSGESHCMLLTALANAMGLNVNEFGSFDDGSGPLEEILI